MRLLGAARVEDLLGRPFPDRIAPEYHHCIHDRIRSQRENGMVAPAMEQEYLRLDGTRVPVETSAVAIRFQNQDGHLVFVRDIRARREAETERKNLEAQLRQAQKLESIGLLAGGVAHDFNNLLMGILGCAELARDEIAADDPIRWWLDEITVGARRSAAITRQLLAFARKQPISPVVLDLNDHLTGMLKLLRRLIREDIELTWRPSAREAWIRMDMSQIDQIMANLVVNSRDAIVGVGSLIIETRHVVLDAERCAGHAGVVPGDYVVLAVSDSGCGMDRATRERIFEPFFTTKDPGKGTGLGLSTVYGIVQQNQGFLEVDSEPGKGTTFRIYIPGLAPEEANRDVPSAAVEATRGSETVLLVEDEKSVRLTTGMFLQGLGYTVLTAADPEEALRQVEDYPGTIHLLITDVVMPGMSGRDLNTKLAEVFPEISCLYVSGYTADIIANQGVPNEGMHFLAKPFTRKELARKARDVLRDRGSRSPARNRDRDVQNP
ncbi:MAG: ATP-binding protein [Kiritimatiellia bacterium]